MEYHDQSEEEERELSRRLRNGLQQKTGKYQALVKNETEFEQMLEMYENQVQPGEEIRGDASDYPPDQQGRRVLVGRLFAAIKNMDKIVDTHGKVSQNSAIVRISQLSDIQVEFMSWMIMVRTNDPHHNPPNCQSHADCSH